MEENKFQSVEKGFSPSPVRDEILVENNSHFSSPSPVRDEILVENSGYLSFLSPVRDVICGKIFRPLRDLGFGRFLFYQYSVPNRTSVAMYFIQKFIPRNILTAKNAKNSQGSQGISSLFSKNCVLCENLCEPCGKDKMSFQNGFTQQVEIGPNNRQTEIVIFSIFKRLNMIFDTLRVSKIKKTYEKCENDFFNDFVKIFTSKYLIFHKKNVKISKIMLYLCK